MQEIPMSYKLASLVRMPMDFLNARKRLEGKYPKQRLTDKEIEALNSLSDARGDIQKLFGFLKGRPLTERENILRSEIFMRRWRQSAEVILNRMIEIEKYITQ